MDEYVNKIIELYTKSRLGDEAKNAFHSWLTEDSLSEEKEESLLKLWNETSNHPSPDTLESLAALKSKSEQNRNNNDRKKLVIWRYAAAIALIAALATSYIFTHNNSAESPLIERFTEAGQMDTITLPDGSIVQTNSRTIVLYSESFGKTNRNIYLSGEANFKVKKNEDIPFVVKAKGFSVTALGTEFDVLAYNENPYFKTTLIHGSIKVQQNGSEDDYTLKVKDQFFYNKKTEEYSISKVDLHEATAWQRGELIFRSATIEEILSVLEYKYGVSFQYKSNIFNKDKYNFRFKKESTLNDIMEVVKGVAGNFKYQKVNDSYYITP